MYVHLRSIGLHGGQNSKKLICLMLMELEVPLERTFMCNDVYDDNNSPCNDDKHVCIYLYIMYSTLHYKTV